MEDSQEIRCRRPRPCQVVREVDLSVVGWGSHGSAFLPWLVFRDDIPTTHGTETVPWLPVLRTLTGLKNYRELRNVISSCFSSGVKPRKCAAGITASRRWRRIASSSVK